MFGIISCRPDNPETPKAVAKRKRNGHLDCAVLHQALGVGKGDVSDRHIHVIDGREDKLNWTAFRTDHEIDASGIARETLLHLCAE